MMPFRACPTKVSASSLRKACDLRTVRRPLRPVVVLLLAILGTSAIRLRLLSMPLERDEGEYAYAGQLILEGHPPYEQLYNMKWPGTYYSYALIESICGQSIEGIRFGVVAVNVGAILLLFLIARRVLDAGRGRHGGHLRRAIDQSRDAQFRGSRHSLCRSLCPIVDSVATKGPGGAAPVPLFLVGCLCRLCADHEAAGPGLYRLCPSVFGDGKLLLAAAAADKNLPRGPRLANMETQSLRVGVRSNSIPLCWVAIA
jgi:hypothetical protein